MTHSEENPIEVMQRFSRRSMVMLLFVVSLLGGTALALILSPEGAVGRSANRAMWLIPIVIVLAGLALQSTLRGRRWNPELPEVRAVMQDELRRVNMDKASRIAFIILVAIQWPMALLLGATIALPGLRIAMAMAAGSITIGVFVFIALFLFLDRE